MKIKSLKYLFVALLLPLQSFAEDIDLFVNPPPVADAGPANVLIILDNTANWNVAFENEVEALKDLFFGLPDPNAWNVGLMMFGDSPNLGYVRAPIRNMGTPFAYDCDDDPTTPPVFSCDVPDDGIDDDIDLTINFLYGAMIKNFDVSTGTGDGGNARTLARTFAEAYRYLRGQPSVDTSTNNGFGANDRRDWWGNVIGEKFSDLVYALDPNEFGPHALDSVGDYIYNSPPDNGICGNTYVIYIGNTVAGGNVTKDNNSRNEAAKTDLEYAAINDFRGLDADEVTEKIIEGYNYTAHQGNYADEWARLMHEELGIIFYAVDVDPTPYPPETGGKINGLGNSDLLRSLSEGVGGGEYFRVDSDSPGSLEDVFKEIFNKIQAKNSVFASVALPASTTGNSTFINQVFIGLFRPDANAFPLWPGNLKQYKLELEDVGDISSVALFDANDQPAIDGSTDSGFLDECARSFWTPSSLDLGADTPYWSFDPRGVCPPYDSDNPSPLDTPDGPYVEKGAQGYVMRQVSEPLDRKVFTCDPDINLCTSMTDFDTDNGDIPDVLDPNDPNDPLYQERDDLIEWAIGRDLENDDGDTDFDETRAYIHGDVIHSRPVALNYGTDTSPEVVVFYGANDGMLRAINGNQAGDVAGAAPGEELWAFMPPEYYDQIKWLKLNEKGEAIKFPATGPDSVGRTGIPKPYGIDGPLIAFSGPIEEGMDTSEKKYIIAGMRRGGRSVYAFDVTDPNDPEMLWKKGCGESGGCASNTGSEVWDGVGQTWSPPSIAYLEGQTNPVLIMGGGYDTCEDTDDGSGNANHSCDPSTTTGNGIYILDILNGEILKRLTLPDMRSVPGGVTVVPVPGSTPWIQFAYAADTGGNVYRIRGPLVDSSPTAIGSAAPAEWTIQRIATFACGEETGTGCVANRKFLFGPDVVRTTVSGSIFRILNGSGDREKPLISYSATTDVDNYFYSFVDQPLLAGWPDSVDPDPLETPVTDVCGENVICKSVLFPVSISPDPEKIAAISAEGLVAYPLGYAVMLSDEEQVVTGSLVVGNVANFSTHIPYSLDPNEFAGIPDDEIDRDKYCVSGLGKATTYNIGFEDAGGDLIDIYTGGLVPSPVAGEVLICDDAGDCKKVPFCIGCGEDNSPIGGGTVGTGTKYSVSKGRVYWNIEQ